MYKIIIDSCGELTEELKADGHYESVPLEMEVNGHRIVDDAAFDQQDFLKKVKALGFVRLKNCIFVLLKKDVCPFGV